MRRAFPDCARRWLGLFLLIGTLPLLGQDPAVLMAGRVLTNCAQVRTLSAEEARRGLGVRLRAVVTLAGDSALLFVQDETGGIFVSTAEPIPVSFGTSVEVTGIAQPGSHLPFVSGARVIDRGPARMPQARVVTVEQFAKGSEDGNWIQLEAVVQSVLVNGSQVRLTLGVGGRRVLVRIFESSEWETDPGQWVDAEVRIRGVAGARSAAGDEASMLDLLVPHSRYIDVVKPGVALLNSPIRSVKWLRENFPTNQLVHRIRITGRLQMLPGEPFVLRDGDDSVTLTASALRFTANTNDLVLVTGFPTGTKERPRLEGVVISSLAPVGGRQPGLPTVPSAGGGSGLLPVLNDIAEIRRLTVEEASKRHPVLVQGVVTFSHMVDNEYYMLFVQDSTSGIFVKDNQPEASRFPAGSLVELEGFTDPGEFAPMILKTRMTNLGEAPMPAPRVVTVEELLTGRKDSQRVRMNGIITSVRPGVGTVFMRLLAGGTVVDAIMAGEGGPEGWDRYVDADVRITGVCGSTFNEKRQLTGLTLFLGRERDLVILKAAPADPFNVPKSTIRSLSQFNLRQEFGHRVRVSGTVSMRLEGRGIYLQDDTDGLLVPMEDPGDVRPGDQVEVLGFPRPGRPVTSLIEARLRKVGEGPEPVAPAVTSGDLDSGAHDNRLVRMQATFSERRAGTNNVDLLCRMGSWMFEARAEGAGFPAVGRGLAPGSEIGLTGVWAVQRNEDAAPIVARLLLRSPRDVVLLARPSWWNPRVAAVAGGGLLVTVLLASGWVFLLRRQVAERTEQSQKALAMFEASIAQSPSGILIADAPALAIRWASPAALELLGESMETLMKLGLHQREKRWKMMRPDRSPYPDEELPLCRAILEGQATQNEELLISNPKGSLRWVVANAAPIRDRQGAVSAGIMVFHDITGRKRAEEERGRLHEQLLQAQKMESVGRLAGGVAHDFNNMLQAILGNAALALEEKPQTSHLREHLEEILKAAQRSADLTSQLLAFARKQTASPRILDLNDTVSGMLRMLRRLIGEHIQLVWVPGVALWPVKIDPSQLDQVLANLAVNARDAIGPSGKITIETANATLKGGDPAAECPPGDYVKLIVRDNGSGMEPDVVAHLFEPFFTTKAVGKGTGLGLAMIYGIVKQNGGGILVDSTPGLGTSFILFLPRSEPAPAAPVEAKPAETFKGCETVLLVEDEPMVLNLGRRIMEQHGYAVLPASHPETALKLAAEYDGPIHLLVTDVLMPGMNGRELRDRLLKDRPTMRCLFISGYPAESITHEGVLEAGVLLLQKPFTVEDLTRKVREVVG